MNFSSSISDSYSWQLTLFNSMTATHKRIACHLCTMFTAYKRGDQKEMFWGRQKIASLSKCSVTEISRFIKKYKNLGLLKAKQRRHKGLDCQPKFSSNLYQLDEHFFTVLYHLKKSGFVKYWKLHSCRLLTQAYENEELAMFNIGYNFEVINKQMSHGECGKCHTNVPRDSSNPSRRDVPTNPGSVPPKNDHKKKASESIEIPGLTNQGLAFINRYGSMYMIQEINDDYKFNLRHGNKIRNPDKWVASRLRAQMHQQFKVLKSMSAR